MSRPGLHAALRHRAGQGPGQPAASGRERQLAVPESRAARSAQHPGRGIARRPPVAGPRPRGVSSAAPVMAAVQGRAANGLAHGMPAAKRCGCIAGMPCSAEAVRAAAAMMVRFATRWRSVACFPGICRAGCRARAHLRLPLHGLGRKHALRRLPASCEAAALIEKKRHRAACASQMMRAVPGQQSACVTLRTPAVRRNV